VTEPEPEPHPFIRAWQLRDADQWASALAPAVVLKSPLLAEPFVGREAVGDLYATLFEVFDELRVTEQLAAADTHVFYWEGSIGGRPVEGVDLIRADASGQISEIRVLMRPIATLGVVMAGVGKVMGRRQGGLNGALARGMAGPLRLLFAAVQAAATRLGQPSK
jgi:hypothetical protein